MEPHFLSISKSHRLVDVHTKTRLITQWNDGIFKYYDVLDLCPRLRGTPAKGPCSPHFGPRHDGLTRPGAKRVSKKNKIMISQQGRVSRTPFSTRGYVSASGWRLRTKRMFCPKWNHMKTRTNDLFYYRPLLWRYCTPKRQGLGPRRRSPEDKNGRTEPFWSQKRTPKSIKARKNR